MHLLLLVFPYEEITRVLLFYYSWTVWLLKKGPIGVPKRRYLTTNLRRLTSQKSEDLIYMAAEAWNHAHANWRVQGHSTKFLSVAQDLLNVRSSVLDVNRIAVFK